MWDQALVFLEALAAQTGAADFWWGNALMIAVGGMMIYLALAKKYEPFLLIGIGFACIVSNVPGSDLIMPGGLFNYAYQGVALLIIPPLIFLGVGAVPLRDLIARLQATYCRTLGVEYLHIPDRAQRQWFQERMEPSLNTPELTDDDRRRIYDQLVKLRHGMAKKLGDRVNFLCRKRDDR